MTKPTLVVGVFLMLVRHGDADLPSMEIHVSPSIPAQPPENTQLSLYP